MQGGRLQPCGDLSSIVYAHLESGQKTQSEPQSKLDSVIHLHLSNTHCSLDVLWSILEIIRMD